MKSAQEIAEQKQTNILHRLSAVAKTNEVWQVIMLVMDENIQLHSELLMDETCSPEITQRRVGRFAALVEQKNYLQGLWEQAHKDQAT